MEAAAQVQTWEVDRENLVIREVGAGGLALFEVLSATSWADVHLAASAPSMLAALEEALEELETIDQNMAEGRETYVSGARIELLRSTVALARGEVVRP